MQKDEGANKTGPYKQFELKLESMIAENPRTFWNYVNEKRKPNCKANIYKYNDVTLDSPSEIAAVFAQQFFSTFSVPSHRSPHNADSVDGACIRIDSITHAEVKNALSSP